MIFNYKDYKGEIQGQFTNELKPGDVFMYKTYKNGVNYTLKLCKINHKYSACTSCPLIDYYCGGIGCDCYIMKEFKENTIN